jgi:hypothetical protein
MLVRATGADGQVSHQGVPTTKKKEHQMAEPKDTTIATLMEQLLARLPE